MTQYKETTMEDVRAYDGWFDHALTWETSDDTDVVVFNDGSIYEDASGNIVCSAFNDDEIDRLDRWNRYWGFE